LELLAQLQRARHQQYWRRSNHRVCKHWSNGIFEHLTYRCVSGQTRESRVHYIQCRRNRKLSFLNIFLKKGRRERGRERSRQNQHKEETCKRHIASLEMECYENLLRVLQYIRKVLLHDGSVCILPCRYSYGMIAMASKSKSMSISKPLML
jgi:hypothetical protein